MIYDRRPPFEKTVFWSNPYKIKAMITSLVEMVQLSDIDYKTKFRT